MVRAKSKPGKNKQIINDEDNQEAGTSNNSQIKKNKRQTINVRVQYSDDERKKILNFIIDNEGFYNLRGNMFWKEMEKRNVVNRTWQSMKEHFRTKIINNLKHFNISKENKKQILMGYKKTKVVKKTHNQRVRVPKYVDVSCGNSSNEERITERRCELTSEIL